MRAQTRESRDRARLLKAVQKRKARARAKGLTVVPHTGHPFGCLCYDCLWNAPPTDSAAGEVRIVHVSMRTRRDD